MKFIFHLAIIAFLLMHIESLQSAESNVDDISGQSLSLSCNACHGTFGQSNSVIPSINGMDKKEFIQKLREFKIGKRSASVMDRIARGFNDGDFEKMAVWFGNQNGGRGD